MVENSDFSMLLRSQLPDSTLEQVLYLDSGDAAFDLKCGKNNYLYLAAEITEEEKKMLLFFSTHTKSDVLDFIERRFQILYSHVKNYMNLSPGMQIGADAQRGVAESKDGHIFIVQCIDKKTLSSFEKSRTRLRFRDSSYVTLNSKWTDIVNNAYKVPKGGKKLVFAILTAVLLLGGGLTVFLVLRGKPPVEEAPQEVILANLVGETIENAAEYLNMCGIKYTFAEKPRDDVEKGIVINQSIRPYTTVKSGDTISLTVSSGKDYIVSISIEQFPERLDYCVGDEFDFSGMALRAVYSSGTAKVISSGYTYSPQSASKTGSQAVMVSYGENSCVLDVSVVPVELVGISVFRMPDKTEYKVGERLDDSGLKLTLHYNNGATKQIERGFVCETAVLSSRGKQTVVVRYEGLTTEFSVQVSD